MDYLTTHQRYTEFFEKSPLRFADTLPCFKIMNAERRLDFFPLELCRIEGGASWLASIGPQQVPDNYLMALAQGYRLRGAPPEELCAHNATVAESVAAEHLAQLWHMMGVLLAGSAAPAFPEPNSTASSRPYQNGEEPSGPAPTSVDEPQATGSSRMPILPPRGPERMPPPPVHDEHEAKDQPRNAVESSSATYLTEVSLADGRAEGGSTRHPLRFDLGHIMQPDRSE